MFELQFAQTCRPRQKAEQSERPDKTARPHAPRIEMEDMEDLAIGPGVFSTDQ